MRLSLKLALLLLIESSVASAQQKLPGIEIGFRGGWAQVKAKDSFSEEKSTAVAVPTGFFGPVSGIHATFFVSPRFALEPQFGLMRFSSNGNTFSLTMLAVQVMGFLAADAEHSPYVFGHFVTVQEASTGLASESHNGVGAGFGYRTVVRKSLGLRSELRVEHRKESGTTINEIALLFGVGAVLGPKGGS